MGADDVTYWYIAKDGTSRSAWMHREELQQTPDDVFFCVSRENDGWRYMRCGTEGTFSVAVLQPQFENLSDLVRKVFTPRVSEPLLEALATGKDSICIDEGRGVLFRTIE